MSDKRNRALLIAFFIVSVPILFKVFVHTDFYKDFTRESHSKYVQERLEAWRLEIMGSINVSTTLDSGKLYLVVENKSPTSIKNLIVKCTFRSRTEAVLGEGEYTLKQAFYKESTRDINDFTVAEIPAQTDSVSCEPEGIHILSKEDEKKFKLLDEAFKDFTRQ